MEYDGKINGGLTRDQQRAVYNIRSEETSELIRAAQERIKQYHLKRVSDAIKYSPDTEEIIHTIASIPEDVLEKNRDKLLAEAQEMKERGENPDNNRHIANMERVMTVIRNRTNATLRGAVATGAPQMVDKMEEIAK